MARMLATCEAVRTRMFLPDVAGIREAIRQVLKGTTSQLESELRTLFPEQDAKVELFYSEDSDLTGARFRHRLQLTRGFVDEATNAVKVEAAPKALDFLPGAPAGTTVFDMRDVAGSALVDDAGEFVRVELERGIVVISDFRLLRQYVQVTYDSGFKDDTANSDLFLLTGVRSVPDWLQELAITWAMWELTTLPQTGIEEQARPALQAVRPLFLEKKVQSMLDDHTRYEPGAMKPVE